MIVITSTAGTIREDIYDEIYDEAARTIDSYDRSDEWTDERSLFLIYELDSKTEWQDPACWKKANPGLGTIKNIRTLSEKVDKAKSNPALVRNLEPVQINRNARISKRIFRRTRRKFDDVLYVPQEFSTKLCGKYAERRALSVSVNTLVCKEFNIPEVSTESWLSYDEILNERTFDIKELKPRYFIGGADLSSSNDLTAAKALFMLPGQPEIYVLSMYWIP